MCGGAFEVSMVRWTEEREGKSGSWGSSFQPEEGRASVLVIRAPCKISLKKFYFLKKKNE